MSQGLRCEADEDAPAEVPGTGLEFAVIALGGAIGACLRRAAYLLFAPSGELVLWSAAASTLAINLTGAFLLGALLAHIESRSANPLLRPFLAVGVLGTFTTYSTFLFENGTIAAELGLTVAALHLLISIAVGWSAFAIGHRFVDRMGREGPS